MNLPNVQIKKILYATDLSENAVHAFAYAVSLADIYRSIIPFVLVMMVGLVIVMFLPGIALWLPDLYFGR